MVEAELRRFHGRDAELDPTRRGCGATPMSGISSRARTGAVIMARGWQAEKLPVPFELPAHGDQRIPVTKPAPSSCSPGAVRARGAHARQYARPGRGTDSYDYAVSDAPADLAVPVSCQPGSDPVLVFASDRDLFAELDRLVVAARAGPQGVRRAILVFPLA